MLLKRHYEPDALEDWLETRDAEVQPQVPNIVKATGMTETAALKLLNQKYSDANDLPKIAHIEVKHCGKKQNLNQGFIERGVAEGWLSIGDGKITIRTRAEEPDLIFNIERAPGRYSCYTGEKLGGEAAAKAHVATQKGKSPYPQHPAGYQNQAYYQCVMEVQGG